MSAVEEMLTGVSWLRPLYYLGVGWILGAAASVSVALITALLAQGKLTKRTVFVLLVPALLFLFGYFLIILTKMDARISILHFGIVVAVAGAVLYLSVKTGLLRRRQPK